MIAEVISIGDELTSGERLDTNSQWLAQRLGELGVRTMVHTTVADDLAANVEVFRNALERAELVVVTGGLGPTADDLTRQSLADATNRPLQLDAGALAQIEGLFKKRGRPMPERNRVQAGFPAGSAIIPNPQGTAPGIDLTFERAGRTASRIFCLPGVPAEMREMWQATVAPAIRTLVGPMRIIRHKVIKCFGVGESDLEAMLPDLIRRGRDPQVGITVSGATISLRITAAGDTAEDCHTKITPTIKTIRECLGALVYGQDSDELQHAVLELLGSKSATLATAEWGTEGLIAQACRSVPGNEVHYAGGAVVAGLHSVARFLQTDKRAVELSSKEITRQMAEHARTLWQSDFGLAVGEAPPSDSRVIAPITTMPDATNATASAPAAKNLPSIWLALATPEKTLSIAQPFVGHSELLVQRAAKQALNMLRLYLLKQLSLLKQ